MKIPKVKVPSTKGLRKVKNGASSASAAFSKHLSQTSNVSSDTQISSENVSVSGVHTVLAAQEYSFASGRDERKNLEDWGNNILNSLDEIRHGLLIGAIPRDQLNRLAQMLRDRKAIINDPQIIEIIDEIEIRAEVELAKLTRNI